MSTNSKIRPDIISLQIIQGDDLRLICQVVDQQDEPVDISGASDIVWRVSDDVGGVEIASASLNAGIQITDNTGFYIDISSAITAQFNDTTYWPDLRTSLIRPEQINKTAIRDSYHHQARITTSSGRSHTVLDGRLFIRPRIMEA